MNYFLEHIWYIVCAVAVGLVVGCVLGTIAMTVVYLVGVA